MRTIVVVLAAVAVALALPAAALGASGSGGAPSSAPAKVGSASCVAGCPTLNTAKPGSLLRLSGADMGSVRHVVFLGGRGRRDDVSSPAFATRPDGLDVLVPAGVRSGPLRTINANGPRSRASTQRLVIRRKAPRRPVQVRAPRRAFAGVADPARIDVLTQQPFEVSVALVRLPDGAPVAVFPLGAVPPGTVRSVTWDGSVAGVPQPAGRYEFRVYASAAGGRAAQAGAPPVASRAFDLLDHIFPVRGPHGFGEFAATFGGGRGHQGQDVFAECGTPIVAARGGTVTFKRFQARAGHYVVIRGAGTGLDYVYMHLRTRAIVDQGATVGTGQVIGHVGQTGRTTGCHLHFELWTAPGWQAGGQPLDPLPLLRAWDAAS